MKNSSIIPGLVSVLAILALSACDDVGDARMLEKARLEGKEQARGELEAQLDAKDRLIERARAEGRVVAEQEILAQNEMLTKRARIMEKDLLQRQRFYQALAGVYEGDLGTEEGNYRIKITLVPSVFPYTVERTRLPEEIAQDLNLLSFDAQIVEWNPASSKSGIGCRIENIRPDLTSGTITISKETCASVYMLSISDGKRSAGSEVQISKNLAALILSGKANAISEIVGVKRPTTNAQEYPFRIRKRN